MQAARRRATPPGVAVTATASAPAAGTAATGASVAASATTIRPGSIHATCPPPTAGWEPGRPAGAVAPGRTSSPAPRGCCHASESPSALGSVAPRTTTSAAEAGDAASTSAQPSSAAASATRRPRRIAGRSAMAAAAAAPRSVPAAGASAITGRARPTPNARPIAAPRTGSPSATLTAASAHTANERMKVVKPRPSSTP